MKITDLRLERGPEAVRACARITWEDCAREPIDLVFEAEAPYSEDLALEPEAFLSACALPAMREGERRIAIAGPACPRLAEGIGRAIDTLLRWYGPPRAAVAIEPAEGFRELARRRPERTAIFFTGGIDSRHLLAMDRRERPVGDAAAIAAGLSTFGHLCPATGPTLDWNARAVEALARSAADAGLDFVAVRSNVWALAPDIPFLTHESLSSALAASAHLFRGRWSAIFVASSREESRDLTRGIHPEIDPHFSSTAVRIRHGASPRTRLERLEAIAAAPRAVEELVVCLAFPGPPYLNCGECEKCVRTMTGLVAVGALARAHHFPKREVDAEMVRGVPIGLYDTGYWTEMVPRLAARGRTDLVEVIREKAEEARRLQHWHADAGWKGRLRRWDRRLLGGRLLRLRRRLFGLGA
jgi:hypothetical protein